VTLLPAVCEPKVLNKRTVLEAHSVSLRIEKLAGMTNLLLPSSDHSSRESWLQAAVHALGPLFAAKGYVIPPCQVSVGFASTGTLRGHIGQCWSTKSCESGVNQVFISPTLADSFDVLDTLVHELVHAVDDCEHKHGKEFKKIALKLGLKGPMRSASAGDVLKAQLIELGQRLGPYPHSALKVSLRTRPRLKRPRAKCEKCDFQVPMLKKFLAYGPPICPQHMIVMEPLGDWDDV